MTCFPRKRETPQNARRSCIYSGGLRVPTPFPALRFRDPSLLLHGQDAMAMSLLRPSFFLHFTAQPGTCKPYLPGPQELHGDQGNLWVQVALPSQGVPVVPHPPAGVQGGESDCGGGGISPQSVSLGPPHPGLMLSLEMTVRPFQDLWGHSTEMSHGVVVSPWPPLCLPGPEDLVHQEVQGALGVPSHPEALLLLSFPGEEEGSS